MTPNLNTLNALGLLWGQPLPSQDFYSTAALPLKPDIARRGWHGRKVPRADIRQTHPIRRRRANGFSGSGADRSGVLALIAATETLLAIHLRPVELGSVPKAIKFIFHAPPDVPSA
jgi:hypothetical protein